MPAMHPAHVTRFSRPRSLAVALTLGLLAGFGCAPRKVVHSQTPEPWLCELDGGKYCPPCPKGKCPQGKGGWLCCSGSVCVAVQTTAECGGGKVGWCSNYTEKQTCNSNGYCTTTATCHDNK